MWTLRMIPEGRGGLADYVFLNPMVVPLEMMRCGLDGTDLGITNFWIGYSIVFALASFFIGAIIFTKTESKAVKYI